LFAPQNLHFRRTFFIAANLYTFEQKKEMSDPSITSDVGPASGQLISLTSARTKVGNMSLTADQATTVPGGLKTEVCIIPSTSAPGYGSYFVIDIKEKNILLHNIVLQFNINQITGLTGSVANFPHFNPMFYAFTRIEIVMNGTVLDTIYGNQQFIMNQLFWSDQDRAYINAAAGHYASQAQRNALATSASNYYVNLKTLFDQNSVPILTTAHEIQLRVYTDSIANIVNQSTLTGTPVANINFCNAICRVTRLPTTVVSQQLALMSKLPFSHIFHDLRYATFTLASGVTSSTVVLTPVVGRVAALIFVARPTASLTGNNAFSYTAISNFAVLNSSSSNIVGGQAINSALALEILGMYNVRSSYLCETSVGANTVGTVQNNNANVYIWSFSSDLIGAVSNGQCLNSYQFQGNEQLQIQWASTLAASMQMDVYALTEAVLTQGVSGIVKSAL
jgi:hypothetical protein